MKYMMKVNLGFFGVNWKNGKCKNEQMCLKSKMIFNNIR